MAFIVFGRSRMNEAIRHGNLDKIRALLDKGLNTELRDEQGDSFLINAIFANKPAVVDVLLAAGASTAAPVRWGTVLHYAAQRGNLEIVEKLATHNPLLLHKLDSNGNTPLHKAAANGHEDVVVFLLHMGVDPHVKNKQNRTALFLAQTEKHDKAVQLLDALPKPAIAYAIPQLESPRKEPAVETDWHKISSDKIAHVQEAPQIGYRITEIFNFSAAERVTLFHNLETKVETVSVKSFSQLDEKEPLEKAFAELQKRGGRAMPQSIGGIAGKRKTLPPPAS